MELVSEVTMGRAVELMNEGKTIIIETTDKTRFVANRMSMFSVSTLNGAKYFQIFGDI